jgi:hypothetical protein
MSETMVEIDERLLFDPATFDVESLGGLDGRELAELFKRLEAVRRRTEGALAAVAGSGMRCWVVRSVSPSRMSWGGRWPTRAVGPSWWMSPH